MGASHVQELLLRVQKLPMTLHDIPSLSVGAWTRRDQHSLKDALYVELAAQLDAVVITTDHRLARATPLAVGPPGMIGE